MNESPCSDIQSTLARLEQKIDKLERHINPPFWAKLLHFIGRNFFAILTLVVLVVLAYRAWELYQHVLSEIEEIKAIPANVIDSGKDSVENLIDKIKFW